MLRILKILLLAAVVILFVDFAVVNRETVRLSLFPLPYSVDMPLFLFAIASVALGAAAAGFVTGVKVAQTKHLLKIERRRAQALENELKALKSEQESLRPALSKIDNNG